MKEFEGKETAQIVDRYRFHDLFPCSPAELKSIGYSDVIAVSSKSKVELPTTTEPTEAEEEEEEKVCRPDFSQMIPFKPKMDAYTGEHVVSGKLNYSICNLLQVYIDILMIIWIPPRCHIVNDKSDSDPRL